MKFTFHNVSINSKYSNTESRTVWHLHSIMYLLIPESTAVQVTAIINLHSIMYLLIRSFITTAVTRSLNLHSMMWVSKVRLSTDF